MSRAVVLVAAPHPDDETLGCGGTLLRHRAAGDDIHWLIATEMDPRAGFSPERIAARNAEIEVVRARYRFSSVTRLGLPTTRLDTVPLGDVVAAMAKAVAEVRPTVLYLPFAGDPHSDHQVVAAAGFAASKWFRSPTLQRVLAYETVSETDLAIDPAAPAFRPTVFTDIAPHLEEKLAILDLYAGETGAFPFPRSARALRALAEHRGASCGRAAAEAFMLLRQIDG